MSFVRTEDCINAASLVFGVPAKEILSDRRSRDIMEARFAAAYVARSVTNRSLPVIGKAMNRDHTTIMNAIKGAELRMNRDPKYAANIAQAIEIAKKADRDGHHVERFIDEILDHAKLVLQERARRDPLGMLNKLLK